MRKTAILLIDCPDRKGIVATVADLLYRHNANILHADQHQDAQRGLFFMRVEWDLQDFDTSTEEFAREFAAVADAFAMRWRLEQSARRPRVAIFVSRYDHCLVLYRHRTAISIATSRSS
jgi:formyltetrahydrofolate deformylase